VDLYLHVFLTSVIDGGEWSASRLSRLTPEDSVLKTNWIGSRVGVRVSVVANRKNSFPAPGRPASSLATILPQLPGTV